jgi:hypothetical protein
MTGVVLFSCSCSLSRPYGGSEVIQQSGTKAGSLALAPDC